MTRTNDVAIIAEALNWTDYQTTGNLTAITVDGTDYLIVDDGQFTYAVDLDCALTWARGYDGDNSDEWNVYNNEFAQDVDPITGDKLQRIVDVYGSQLCGDFGTGEHVYPAGSDEWADSRETSIEIARAIAELATADRGANTIWSDPTDDEFRAIYLRAWELADEDEEELYWGDATYYRGELD